MSPFQMFQRHSLCLGISITAEDRHITPGLFWGGVFFSCLVPFFHKKKRSVSQTEQKKSIQAHPRGASAALFGTVWLVTGVRLWHWVIAHQQHLLLVLQMQHCWSMWAVACCRFVWQQVEKTNILFCGELTLNRCGGIPVQRDKTNKLIWFRFP